MRLRGLNAAAGFHNVVDECWALSTPLRPWEFGGAASVVQVGVFVVVAVVGCVPVPVVQVVQVVVVGDGAVAAAVAVDVVVFGGVVRPMLPGVGHGQCISPGDEVDEAGPGAWLGRPRLAGQGGTDRTGDNDAWARAIGRSTASPNNRSLRSSLFSAAGPSGSVSR